MILSRQEIRGAVERKEIRFDPPLEERQWGEASVDLRLGLSFTKLKPAPALKISMAGGIAAIADSGLWQEATLKVRDKFNKRETFVLEPNEFVLALTCVLTRGCGFREILSGWLKAGAPTHG